MGNVALNFWINRSRCANSKTIDTKEENETFVEIIACTAAGVDLGVVVIVFLVSSTRLLGECCTAFWGWEICI